MKRLLKKYAALSFRKKIMVIASLLLIVGCTLFVCDSRLKIVPYTVKSSKIQTPVRLVVISDLHSCKYGKGQQTLVKAIQAQKPDLLLYTGDIFEDTIPHTRAKELLAALKGQYPAYYVTGNHEYWSGEADKIVDILKSHDVTVLSGTWETVEVRGQRLNICGVDDPDIVLYSPGARLFEEQLEDLRGVPKNGLFTLLLSHRPERINTYLQYDFDLILAGHAHGGQWRIPGLLNGLYSPDQGLFPRYAGGRYTYEKSEMLVSRGLARESTRLVPRIFNRPELLVVDLIGEASAE